MIQVRNVPDEIHRKLRRRAAIEGLSLSDFLLREIRKVAERPTAEELKRRLNELTPVTPECEVADMVRLVREEREEQLWPSSTRRRSSS